MKRLMIIGLWPDDTVNYCTEKCDCRRYAFDRILYHKGGRAARERICIPVVDRSGAVTTYLDLPVTLLEAGVVYLRLDDGSDIFLSGTQMALIANEVERQRAECAGTGLKTLGKWFESGLPTAEDYLEPGDEVDEEIAKICDSYGYGFARGVYEAFTRQNEENQEYGLVLKVPEEVKDELEKIGPPKEFKKTPQPKTVGELDAAWRGVEDGRKFDPSNKLEEKKQEA